MEKVIISISGMHCASCAINIEKVFQGTEGINSVVVNFALEKAYIQFDPQRISLKDIKKKILST